MVKKSYSSRIVRDIMDKVKKWNIINCIRKINQTTIPTQLQYLEIYMKVYG